MALPSSGTISLSDIQTEFGGTNPISMSEYYRGGSFVTDNNTDIPTSGTIAFDDFYGGVKQFIHTITSDQQEIDLSTYLTAQGWGGAEPVVVTVDTGVYIWSDDTAVGGLTIPSSMNGLVTLTNNGYIIGRGGDGNGNDGGPALVNNATGVTLTNASGAYIAGGGGGGYGSVGGGGAGGGDGGSLSGSYPGAGVAGTGGAVGVAGSAGGNGNASAGGGSGGGAGGGGGGYTAIGAGLGDQTGGGGGGGRILPGSGGSGGYGSPSQYIGGDGGSAGNAGNAPNGGGGWGAAGGGGGGAGGAAISGTAIATYTNNGTVYGSTA